MSYSLIVILQIFCVLHVINRRKDRWWIWFIVFVPLVGSTVYLLSEVFGSRDLGKVQQGLGLVLNPGAKIKELEKRLAFSDTQQNKIALADAYLANGELEKAIDLYESTLEGLFKDDPHANTQLVSAYYLMENYEKAVEKAHFILYSNRSG